ncbi:glycosyltransferase family 2 protein [Luteimonas dalianensis]|uniref:glycosyltransferase family 2 protein n=1 Tax=Luteimonas dalianensis TaxID=1148196 RepID=UPI003BF1F934
MTPSGTMEQGLKELDRELEVPPLPAGARDGARLLRVEAEAAGTLHIADSAPGGESRERILRFRPGVTCVPLDRASPAPLRLRHGPGPASVQVVDVPGVRVEAKQPYACPVVCGLASIPSRVKALRVAVASLLHQVDHLFVYLNGFDSVPGFLVADGITVFRSGDYGDYRDNSKYFGLRCLDEEVYFFSVDDDIEYPRNYVSALVAAIERYDRQAMVGVHGVVYGAGSRLFLDRAVLHFGEALDTDLPVSALGTGTTAFHTSTLRFDSLEFVEVGMADLVLSRVAAEQGVPAISVARPAQWLRGLDVRASAQNLYAESTVVDSPHDLFIRKGGVPGPGRIHGAILGSPAVQAALAADASAFLAYLVALESNADSDSLAVPHGTLLVELAARLRWPGLALAVARGALVGAWKTRKDLALATGPIRAASLGLSGSTWNELTAIVDEHVAGFRLLRPEDEYVDASAEAEDAALAAGRTHGDSRLGLALLVLKLVVAGRPKALLRVYAELLRAELARLAGEVHDALSGLSPATAAEAVVERASVWMERGAVEDVLDDAARLVETGHLGRQIVAVAGLLTGKPWTEDMVLTLFAEAGNARQLRRIRALTKVLTKVPLPSCSPEIWADLMPGMDKEVRRFAAAALVANRAWSERIPLDSLDLGSRTEMALWRAATRAPDQFSFRDAQHAVNAVFLSGGLLPVEVGTGPADGFFHALVAEPLPPFRDPAAPLVSVVMAVYDGQETIDYALRSVLAQTYPNIEVILVDDCSPTPLQLPEWARERPDVVLKRASVNCGPYECRNIALATARGDFVATQDADDWMHPQKIERQVMALMQSNAVASYNRHIRLLADGAPALENNGQFMGDGPITSMFRRPVFDAIGGFMAVRTRGDMEFKSRIVNRYRASRILHDDAVTLLALDSMASNSKVFTRTAVDEQNVARFKRWYSIEQPVAYFRTRPAVPPNIGKLFPKTGEDNG